MRQDVDCSCSICYLLFPTVYIQAKFPVPTTPITLAAHAFPLGHWKIMCYALEIVCMQNPSCEKIGESWFCCFQSCHSEKLKAAWTKSLDTSRAAAVNPTTITHYFQLLKATLDNFNFVPKEIYGF